MKIYTRRGDKGYTSMIDKKGVRKDNPRVAAYGDVDELNSLIGICLNYVKNVNSRRVLKKIQRDLLSIGSLLAGYKSDKNKNKVTIDEGNVFFLEKEIDKAEEKNIPLRKFIIPGGSKGSSYLHFARSVARRAERSVVKINRNKKYDIVVKYLNRLSDLIFVLARLENKISRIPDTLW